MVAAGVQGRGVRGMTRITPDVTNPVILSKTRCRPRWPPRKGGGGASRRNLLEFASRCGTYAGHFSYLHNRRSRVMKNLVVGLAVVLGLGAVSCANPCDKLAKAVCDKVKDQKICDSFKE